MKEVERNVRDFINLWMAVETDVQMSSANSIRWLKGRLIQLRDPLLALHGNNLCCYCIAYFRWLARLILSTLSLVSPKLHSQASF